ncbi:MAG: hypothetical protein U0414_42045 [Polyangiaceae bacterium]
MAAAPETKIRHPLRLPRGSVRALLALCVAGTTYWLVAHPSLLVGDALPPYLVGALPIVLAYYFAQRASGADPASPARAGSRPLWLPGGTVRVLLAVGFFVAAGFYLFGVGVSNVTQSKLAPFLFEVGIFLAGQLSRAVLERLTKGKPPAPWRVLFDDVKALVALLAAAGLVLVHTLPETALPESVRGVFAKVFPLVISFYFGAR